MAKSEATRKAKAARKVKAAKAAKRAQEAEAVLAWEATRVEPLSIQRAIVICSFSHRVHHTENDQYDICLDKGHESGECGGGRVRKPLDVANLLGDDPTEGLAWTAAQDLRMKTSTLKRRVTIKIGKTMGICRSWLESRLKMTDTTATNPTTCATHSVPTSISTIETSFTTQSSNRIALGPVSQSAMNTIEAQQVHPGPVPTFTPNVEDHAITVSCKKRQIIDLISPESSPEPPPRTKVQAVSG
jgi:hypothetical protein